MAPKMTRAEVDALVEAALDRLAPKAAREEAEVETKLATRRLQMAADAKRRAAELGEAYAERRQRRVWK